MVCPDRQHSAISFCAGLAGTPRHFDVIMSNGEPALVDNRNPARPALAGAALAEAAEQAGGRIAGWVTDFVKSGMLLPALMLMCSVPYPCF